MRILFVCMGNICRSPTAEGVMRHLIMRRGMRDAIEVDSAGTGAWHVGNAPDPRSAQAARARGIEIDGAARQIELADFERFDLILAADVANLRDLRHAAPDEAAAAKLHLLREYDPASAGERDLDVADPYYGGPRGFDDVFDQIYAACAGLLASIAP